MNDGDRRRSRAKTKQQGCAGACGHVGEARGSRGDAHHGVVEEEAARGRRQETASRWWWPWRSSARRRRGEAPRGRPRKRRGSRRRGGSVPVVARPRRRVERRRLATQLPVMACSVRKFRNQKNSGRDLEGSGRRSGLAAAGGGGVRVSGRGAALGGGFIPRREQVSRGTRVRCGARAAFPLSARVRTEEEEQGRDGLGWAALLGL